MPLTDNKKPPKLNSSNCGVRENGLRGFLCQRWWRVTFLPTNRAGTGQPRQVSFRRSPRHKRGCAPRRSGRGIAGYAGGQIDTSAMPCELSSALKVWSSREIHPNSLVSRTLHRVVAEIHAQERLVLSGTALPVCQWRRSLMWQAKSTGHFLLSYGYPDTASSS